MGKINWTRVILGGLVAGVVINISEFVLNGVVLAKDMEAAISALGRQMGGGESDCRTAEAMDCSIAGQEFLRRIPWARFRGGVR